MVFIKNYEEILKRCKEQGIETEGFSIYLTPHNLNGKYCLEGTLSHDGLWICIPEIDEEQSTFFDHDVYVPTCYEIKDRFKTYLKGDSLSYLVEGYILYDRK